VVRSAQVNRSAVARRAGSLRKQVDFAYRVGAGLDRTRRTEAVPTVGRDRRISRQHGKPGLLVERERQHHQIARAAAGLGDRESADVADEGRRRRSTGARSVDSEDLAKKAGYDPVVAGAAVDGDLHRVEQILVRAGV